MAITQAMIEAAAPFHCYNSVGQCSSLCTPCKTRAKAALEAAEAAEDAAWQPIETAPKGKMQMSTNEDLLALVAKVRRETKDTLTLCDAVEQFLRTPKGPKPKVPRTDYQREYQRARRARLKAEADSRT